MQHSPVEVGIPKLFEVGADHRDEPDLALAAREGVLELSSCGEGRGPGGEHPHFREMIGRNLQHLRGVHQAVDFIENHYAAGRLIPPKELWLFQRATDSDEFAVIVATIGHGLREGGLAGATDSREPHHRSCGKGTIEFTEPKGSGHHEATLRKVRPNESMLSAPWRIDSQPRRAAKRMGDSTGHLPEGQGVGHGHGLNALRLEQDRSIAVTSP